MHVIDGRMNVAMYRDILNRNLHAAAAKLDLPEEWVFQQDNDPKHTAKYTKKWLTDHNVESLEEPSQSPD